ncbi:MAG: glutamate--cysteine ligase [Pseudanabaenaceae cyanobacterium]
MLSKGFEVELYTATPQGEVVGLSDRIVRDLQGFVREPDSRNVEYTTPPLNRYEQLLVALLQPRRILRAYLKTLGDYTIMPGSTIPLWHEHRFFRSDPQNPYHAYIEQTYGTRVVTASVHINIGISDPETLFRVCRVIRLEAPLYLALSASSPFYRGEVTGYHSARWQMFPKTPPIVPLFRSHQHYIEWTNAQLALGTMQNVRHLWCAVRPNGTNRPYDLNRLELRICDLVIDPTHLLAITALLEGRIQQIISTNLDIYGQFTPVELQEMSDANELLAARNSLDAELIHWQTGEKILARDWLKTLYEQVYPLWKQQGNVCFLTPLLQILSIGNEAQQWLAQLEKGKSIHTVVAESIQAITAQEEWLAQTLGVVNSPQLA